MNNAGRLKQLSEDEPRISVNINFTSGNISRIPTEIEIKAKVKKIYRRFLEKSDGILALAQKSYQPVMYNRIPCGAYMYRVSK